MRFRWIPRFDFGITSLQLTYPVTRWLPGARTLGSADRTQTGVPGAVLLLRKYTLALTLRFTETEWGDVQSFIQFGQSGASFLWFPGDFDTIIETPMSIAVYLDAPHVKDVLRPLRDATMPWLLTLPISLTRVDGAVFDLQYFRQPPEEDTTPPVSLTIPDNFTAVADTTFSAALAWDDVVGAETYDIERDGDIIASVPFGSPSYEDTTLTSEVTYTYRVRAVAGVSTSDYTDPIDVTPSWTMVPNLEFWAESDFSGDITIATGVSVWADHRTNGRELAQATGGQQPTVVSGAINGLDAIRFDGIDDLLAMTLDFELNLALTVFIYCDVKFANDVNYRPLLRLDPSNAIGIQHESDADGTSPSKLEAFVVGGGLVRATPGINTAMGPRLITVVMDGTFGGIAIYKDGVLQTSNGGFSGVASSIGDVMRLCADETGVNFGQYDVAAMLVYSIVVDTDQQFAIESYLMSKWS